PTPYEAQADQELRVTVAEALTALPQPQQQALELAYYEGLTHAEIAEKLHLPLGTVKTRIKLALSKLRDALRPYWNHGESV
ncbi:MAG: sigma-70 family RNA polymerase sigma factor, partial [Nitrospira sp.]|nr:sigma-70 family RNA polymerase sigma factor [Nitrospira sp.]